jgi:uncharacterized protein YndB with AHSA1/START domain
MTEIVVERSIAAPPQRVWDVLIDHEGMTRWLPVREVVRRRPGTTDPNGVGAVRTIRGMGLVLEERVTEAKAPERLSYELTGGAPLRDHRGDVTLTPEPGGTRVRWTVRFRPLVPGTGWLLALALKQNLARGLEGLAGIVTTG